MAPKKISVKDRPANFEDSLRRLEEIVEGLESGSASLDEVLAMYEEGVQLSKVCLEHISRAELKIQELSKDLTGKFELVNVNLKDR